MKVKPHTKTVPAVEWMFLHNNFLQLHCNKCLHESRQTVCDTASRSQRSWRYNYRSPVNFLPSKFIITWK